MRQAIFSRNGFGDFPVIVQNALTAAPQIRTAAALPRVAGQLDVLRAYSQTALVRDGQVADQGSLRW